MSDEFVSSDAKKERDQALGMGARITRRDFLNGVALTVGAAAVHGIVPPEMWAAVAADLEAQDVPGYYPPGKTGLRGDHAGSFETMHKVADGAFWDGAPKAVDTGESYDLVIVGGGFSGLAAAHYFRKAAGDKARVLILENHDDFGGHAKRNEFRAGGRTILGFGGTYSIESPAPYSAVAKALIEELGIDVPSYHKYVSKDLYRSFGMKPRIFFDQETFGADKLVVNAVHTGEDESGLSDEDKLGLAEFLKEAPLSAKAKQDFQRLLTGDKDYFPGLSSDEKKARLARMSYAKYLTDTAGASDEIVKLLQAFPHPLFGVGIDAVAAQDAWGLGLPGFNGLKLDPTPGKGMNRDCIHNDEAEKYFFHHPDGAATIARLLVRKLIPAALPGDSATDVVLAKADYSKLDEPSSAMRIRLNSTVVKVNHRGDPARAKEVEVTYFYREQAQDGARRELHSGVLACGDSVHRAGIAGGAKTSAGFGAESSAALQQRAGAQLERLPEAGHECDLRARHVPHRREPGYSGQHRRLRMYEKAGRADRGAHDEGGLQAGTSGARAA